MEDRQYCKETEEKKMNKKKVFISFDFENDEDLRNFLVGQAKNSDSPFEISDYSLKQHLTGDWKEKIRMRIKRVEIVIILCGHKTNIASGVSAELSIAKEEEKSYFLLAGRKEGSNKKPQSATSSDRLYKWTWDNLKLLIHGER